MKIKTKIHLFSTLLMFVILIMTNTGVYFLFEKMALDSAHKQLREEVAEVTESFSKMTSENDPAVIIRAHYPNHGAIRIFNAAGETLGIGYSEPSLTKFIPKFKANAQYAVNTYEGTPVLTIRSPVIWSDGEIVDLHMIQSLTEMKQSLTMLKMILTIVTLVALLPVLFFSMGLSRIVFHPVERLVATMSESRRAGTYEQIPVIETRKDEMTEMTLTFNELMEQLEYNYKNQEQFVSDASHELKTPLTVIESYARLLTRHGFDNRDVAEEAVGAILSESLRMKSMIEQLLELARNDEKISSHFEETNLNEQIEKTIQPMRQAYDREFVFEEKVSAIVNTDREKFRQLMYIFLDNARKYSDGNIRVMVEEIDECYLISIIDYGNGISEEAIPHVFNRFYRVEEDRSRRTGGTGLGLAIAKQLSEGLHAQLKMESIVGLGTTIRIHIPKDDADQGTKVFE